MHIEYIVMTSVGCMDAYVHLPKPLHEDFNFTFFITLYQPCHNLVTRSVQYQKQVNYKVITWSCHNVVNNNVNKTVATNLVFSIWVAIRCVDIMGQKVLIMTKDDLNLNIVISVP